LAGGGGGESDGAVEEVEGVAAGDDAVGVFEDEDVAVEAGGGAAGGGFELGVAEGFAVEVELFVGTAGIGSAPGGVGPGGGQPHEKGNQQRDTCVTDDRGVHSPL
jgi:hypothetical protein